MGLLETFTPPPGSPDAVRAGARCWREVADRLDRQADEVEQRSLSLSASWAGPAKEAYERQVTPFLDAVRQGAGNLRDGATRLDEVAAKLAGRFAIFTLTGIAADGAAGMIAYGDVNPFDHLHLAEDLEFGAIGA